MASFKPEFQLISSVQESVLLSGAEFSSFYETLLSVREERLDGTASMPDPAKSPRSLSIFLNTTESHGKLLLNNRVCPWHQFHHRRILHDVITLFQVRDYCRDPRSPRNLQYRLDRTQVRNRYPTSDDSCDSCPKLSRRRSLRRTLKPSCQLLRQHQEAVTAIVIPSQNRTVIEARSSGQVSPTDRQARQQ